VFALPVAAAFGFTFTTLVEGRAETRLPWRPDLSHSPGAFQANPIAALADFTGVAAGVTLLLHVGDRAVHLIPLGPGHTDTDLVVNVPDAHAWLVGDVVEASGPPMYGSGCFPLGLPLQLAFLLNEVTDADVVVPGHGQAPGADGGASLGRPGQLALPGPRTAASSSARVHSPRRRRVTWDLTGAGGGVLRSLSASGSVTGTAPVAACEQPCRR